MRKYYYSLLAVSALALPLDAMLIVNGNFANNTQLVTKGGAGPITTSEVDAGWTLHTQPGRTFNGDTATNPGASFQFNSPDGAAGAGGFFLGGDGSQLNQSTAWNLFTGPGASVAGLELDVAVFSSFTNNQGGTTNISGAMTNNLTNVSIALYGFNGTLAQLGTALSNAGVEIRDDKINTPASEFISITGTQSLTAVSGLNTWSTKGFSFVPQQYDYLLFGITGPAGGGINGVGIDNVSLVVVPEPSVYMSLIGFVGLGWFIYRRRRAAKSAEACQVSGAEA